MKLRLTVILVFFVVFASQAFAQTIAISPDSGNAGATVQVTIVGSGTHFKPSQVISGFNYTTVALKRSGQTVYSTTPSITNDSLMTATFMLPSTMSGLYDLSVVRTQDTPTINYTLASAFYVNPAPGKILFVSRNYGYTGQTMHITITGFNTGFTGIAGQIVINFKQNGNVIFQTHGDSILSATQLAATITVPSNASGTFDLQVQNPGFNYSGTGLFTAYPDPGQQSITVSPDSGAAGSSIPVTIVGSGTHFKATGNISGVSATEIDLQRSGQTYYYTLPTQIASDTLMTANFTPSTNLQSGWYDVVVRQTQAPYYAVTETNGFYIKTATPKLLSVSPQSAYQGQRINMDVNGQSTAFGGPPGQITIDFKQSGTTVFSAVANGVLSTTRLSAAITVPDSAPPGLYDIEVTDSGHVYAGSKLFTVLNGPVPNIRIVPDTGISGDTMAVTIIGQNTNFIPSQGISVVNTITLRSGGQTYLQTTPTKVSSATSMDATFYLTQVPAGDYDVELKCGQYYDYTTSYTVIPHTFIVPAKPRQDTVRAGGTVSIGVFGHGTHFSAVANVHSAAMLIDPKVGESSAIVATNVTAQNDTTLTASFTVPAGAPAGSYDLIVTEPRGVQETLYGALIVQSSSAVNDPDLPGIVSNVTISPNPSHDNVSIAFQLGTAGRVELRLFDALGHREAVLCDRILEAGAQHFEWNANVPDGTYIYQLLAGTERRTGKIVVSK